MFRLISFLVLFSAFLAAQTAPMVRAGAGNPEITPQIKTYTVATLPSVAAGSLARISDGASATDCTTGGGSTKVYCEYDGSAWKALSSGGGSSYDPLDRSWIYLVDDFLGGQSPNGEAVAIGQLGWNSKGSTGAEARAAGGVSNGHPGILFDLRTGSTSGNFAYLGLGMGGSSSQVIRSKQFLDYSGWSMEWDIRTDSTITDTFIAVGYFDLSDPNSGAPSSRKRFVVEYDPSKSDTNWMCVTYDGTTATRVSTGISVSTSTYYTLRMEGDAPNSMRCKVNTGSYTTSITSNFPDDWYGHIAWAVQTQTAAMRKIWPDRFAAKIRRE